MRYKVQNDDGMFGSGEVSALVAAIRKLGPRKIVAVQRDAEKGDVKAMRRFYQRVHQAASRAGLAVSGRVDVEAGMVRFKRRDDRAKRARKASPKGARS